MQDVPFTPLSIEDVAMVCHEANRAYCEASGDWSQDEWFEAPENIKESVRAGVRFHLDNPEAGDSASHESWLNFKVLDGWVYGVDKDPKAKTHPCRPRMHCSGGWSTPCGA
jgi:hypothetical protein